MVPILMMVLIFPQKIIKNKNQGIFYSPGSCKVSKNRVFLLRTMVLIKMSVGQKSDAYIKTVYE